MKKNNDVTLNISKHFPKVFDRWFDTIEEYN